MRFTLLYKDSPPLKKFRKWILFFSLLATSCLHAQTVTLSVQSASMENVFSEIKNQTGYYFVYTSELLQKAKPVSLSLKSAGLKNALESLFKDQPLYYSLEEGYVVVVLRKEEPKPSIIIKGKVTDQNGDPLNGASVSIKFTNEGTSTNTDGEFELTTSRTNPVLIITSVGYEPKEVAVVDDHYISLALSTLVSKLDEQVIIAYGTTTKRLNTANISRVGSAEISKQPVSNPLATLYGRVSGLVITQANGIPGSAFKVQIRGQNSINSGNAPLFIIDGVPVAAGNNSINQIGSALGSSGLSPFSVINPDDIESIVVLKDADATAIYGSRGANGVVLITTKKGKAGKIATDINFWTGGSRVTRTMDFLNTAQYVELRKEAFQNDNRSLTPSSAKDLLVWDTTKYTDFKKMFIGGTAWASHMQVSVSGGNEQTQFLIGASYHNESTVFPGDLLDRKTSFHFNLNQSDAKRRFNMVLTGSMTNDNNHINVSDLTGYINIAPDNPDLLDSGGNLVWQKNGFSFTNPLAYLKQEYVAKTTNLLGNLKLSYKISSDLSIKANLGYNSIQINDYSLHPISSQNPASSPQGFNDFGNNNFTSLICEPQIEWLHFFRKSKLLLVTGGTWQQNENTGFQISGYGYTSDDLLKSISAAPQILSKTNSFSQYRYIAAFGRVTYTIADKYLLNFNGRRDGSSRFGPDRQFSNFGSIAGGWVFSKEKFVHDLLPFLSFGKLRGSYGITGNDQINDYQYLDTWSSTVQGTPGLYPTALFNSDFRWEKNRKMEAAIELGFHKDKILVSVAYYNNKSSNQLIEYSLPAQSGASSIISNFPAKIGNTGFEIEASAAVIQSNKFSWTSSFNISVPKNQLLSFPGIESSSYNHLIVGKSINLFAGYYVSGVEPQTGVYFFLDQNGHAISTPKEEDYISYLGNLDPVFYGGLHNNVSFAGFELDVVTEFKKQTGLNYLNDLGFAIPGTLANQPAAILNRWRKPGDEASIQKVTAGAGRPAYTAAITIRNSKSQILYSDASYIRFKTLALSYSLPASVVKRIHANALRLYLQAQNLLTFTSYKGADPETQNLFRLPPLKTLTAGIQIHF